MSDVRRWLEAIGLTQFTASFEANDIDMDLLRQVDDQALRELGMSSTGYRSSSNTILSTAVARGAAHIVQSLH